MKKSARPQTEMLKNIILTGIVAGLTFTLLLVAILPFVEGRNRERNYPTFESVTNESDAASTNLACKSWVNVKIDGCSEADFNRNAAHCTTKSPYISLNFNSTNARKIRYKEFADANSTYCENAKPDSSWKTVNYSPVVETLLTSSLKNGDRKICAQFLDSAGRGGPVCGAITRFRPNPHLSPASLTCKSWENVTINNCTLAAWNKSSNAACYTTANTVTLNLKPPVEATQYRHKFTKLTADCVKENISTVAWKQIPSNKRVSVALPTGDNTKVCVQYRIWGESNDATTPICGAAIRRGIVRDN